MSAPSPSPSFPQLTNPVLERERLRGTHKHTRKYAYAHTDDGFGFGDGVYDGVPPTHSLARSLGRAVFRPIRRHLSATLDRLYTDDRPKRANQPESFQYYSSRMARRRVQAALGVDVCRRRRRALPVAACVGASFSAPLSQLLSLSSASESEGDKHILND